MAFPAARSFRLGMPTPSAPARHPSRLLFDSPRLRPVRRSGYAAGRDGMRWGTSPKRHPTTKPASSCRGPVVLVDEIAEHGHATIVRVEEPGAATQTNRLH